MVTVSDSRMNKENSGGNIYSTIYILRNKLAFIGILIQTRNDYKEWDTNSTKLLINIYKELRHEVGSSDIKKYEKVLGVISNEKLQN